MLKFSEWLLEKHRTWREHNLPATLGADAVNITDLSIISPKNTDILKHAISKYERSTFPATGQLERFVNTLRHDLTNYNDVYRQIDAKLKEGGPNRCSRICAEYNLHEMTLHLIEEMCHQFETILKHDGKRSISLPKTARFGPMEIFISEIISEAKRQKCMKEMIHQANFTANHCKSKIPNIFACPTSRSTPSSHSCEGDDDDEDEDPRMYARGYM